MKKIFYLLTIAFMFPVLSGCEDFLDTKSYTTKDSSSFPKTADDANQMVVGVYNSLTRMTNSVMSSYFLISELACDDRFGGGGYNDKESQALGHLLYSNDNHTNSLWSSHYTGIARCNAAIAALDNLDEGNLKNQKIGEVRIIRALLYFELVQILGDVPLMKAAPENVQEAMESPLPAPQEEIYKFIATDLWEAYNSMPASKWNAVTSGTATKWAAAGLLARVWLFYTGFYQKDALPMENGQVTREQAAAALKDLMDNSGHSLVPDFRSLWPYSNSVTKKNYEYAKSIPDWIKDGNNPEHIFVKKMVPHGSWQSNPQCNEYALFFGIRNGPQTSYKDLFPMGQGWGMGPVNTILWDEWEADEPNDLRRQGSIYNQELEAKNYEKQWGADRMVEETGLWQKKVVATTAYKPNGTDLWNYFTSDPAYYNVPNDNFQHGCGTDLIFLRYADVLLMHSELTKTADGMNAVRARAKLPAVAYSDAALRKERRYELAFEGLRWGDIRRWHIADQVLPKMYGVKIFNETQFKTMKPQVANIGDRYKATKGFFMMPRTQIELAGKFLEGPQTGQNKIKQNAGWGTEALFVQWTD